MHDQVKKVYSTGAYLYAQGEQDGRPRGVRSGACWQLGTLLRRHGKRAFGAPAEEQLALLNRLVDYTDLAQLERLRDVFAAVKGWAELLATAAEPAAPPAEPEYVQPLDLDPEPLAPSIDIHSQVQYKSGQPGILHVRFQRLYQDDLGAILHQDGLKLRQQFGMSVQSHVLLLWPGADGPGMTGTHRTPQGEVYHYRVARLWEKDVDEMLGSLATAVLAPLARVAPERLPEVARRMDVAITAGAKQPEDVAKYWGLAWWTMGLRYPIEQINELLAPYMHHVCRSTDMQAILSEVYHEAFAAGAEEGKRQAAVGWILAVGMARLGETPPLLRQGLSADRHLERLEQIAARVLKAASWEEALARG